MHELVIRGGTVVDGTGSASRTADVAISGGFITAVGRVDTRARQVIDADGLLVTPGFVDIHTHYDGQATWDDVLAPSSWHGVTTAVMGNCGVGFAPARPDRHDWLIGLMESVEDIPGAALADGIRWAWESFPQYLDALEHLPRVMDLGALVPHGAVRAYVMGERGAGNEQATPDDVVRMARIVASGVSAGALGFSTSRTVVHRSSDGEPVPGTFASDAEVSGLCSVLGELGAGLVEVAPAGVLGEDLPATERELAWMLRVARSTRRPVTFALVQHDADPDAWRKVLHGCELARNEHIPLYPQVHTRSPALLVGLRTRFNPFLLCPTWKTIAGATSLVDAAAVAERLHADPPARTQLVAEAEAAGTVGGSPLLRFDRLFALGNPPCYEPDPATSCAAVASRQRRSPYAVLLDWLCADRGEAMVLAPFLNWADTSHDVVLEMLLHPTTVVGLGDGGAHSGSICDASIPTHLLTHWVRDRARGERLPLELAVRKLTRDPAALYGLNDRGSLRPGRKADLNLIDFDRLALRPPEVRTDLPTGAARLVQGADGFHATICAGQVTFERGEPTGARPGAVVRGWR